MTWREERDADAERERMPYIQIDSDMWAVMRRSKTQPVAMIRLIIDRNQLEKYLVLTWHPEPHRRRLVSMHDSLREANASVRWPKVQGTSRRGKEFAGYPPPIKYDEQTQAQLDEMRARGLKQPVPPNAAQG